MRDRAFLNEINALIRRDMREMISTTGGNNKKAAICKLGRGLSPEADHTSILILDIGASRTVEKEVSVV